MKFIYALCISFLNFVLGFGAYSSPPQNTCSVEGSVVVLFQSLLVFDVRVDNFLSKYFV